MNPNALVPVIDDDGVVRLGIPGHRALYRREIWRGHVVGRRCRRTRQRRSLDGMELLRPAARVHGRVRQFLAHAGIPAQPATDPQCWYRAAATTLLRSSISIWRTRNLSRATNSRWAIFRAGAHALSAISNWRSSGRICPECVGLVCAVAGATGLRATCHDFVSPI